MSKSNVLLVALMFSLLGIHYFGQPANDTEHAFRFNRVFGFSVYCPYDTLPELEQELMKANDALLRVIRLMDDKGIQPLLSVSCFSQDFAMSIDTAFFGHTAHHHPNIQNLDVLHEIKEAAKIEYQGKAFYRKTTLVNADLFSVMMYFMENDSSNRMYELKLVGDVGDSSDMKNMLLTIAHTVAFKR